jgi:hypothetical protein
MAVVMVVVTWAPIAFGAVSPEEAAKLGTTLTRFGAEMAGNKEGTIPPYTGGLINAPAGFKPDSGQYLDPFATEQPLFSINAQNMAQYADKLSDGVKFMLKKHPTYRVDIYKTHRTAAYPENILKNTVRNATKAKTDNGGISLRNARAGLPFPIPQNGYEVMWNHLLRYPGRSREIKMQSYLMANAKLTLAGEMIIHEEYPYYDEDETRDDADMYWKFTCDYTNPPRRAGEGYLLFDFINTFEKPRIAYQYLAGQRRVKLAPDLAFDTPAVNVSGFTTFDQAWCFNGSMERYDFKLIGKKEMFVPYNTYKANFQAKKEDLFGPNHLNPVRWSGLFGQETGLYK